jgi:hypothetical protein
MARLAMNDMKVKFIYRSIEILLFEDGLSCPIILSIFTENRHFFERRKIK